MRGGARYPPNSSILPRILLALPLGLAAFALLMQFNTGHPSDDTAAYGLFNEKEFIQRADNIPRLENQLRKSGVQQKSGPSRLPLPHGFGTEAWQWPGGDLQSQGPKIAFVVTTSESVPQIRVWMAYHRAMGVSLFYLFVEGQASTPEAVHALRAETGVRQVIIRDDALIQLQAKSRIWNETWLGAFFNKPCNHELFVKQSLNMEMGVNFASEDSAEWIMHVDTDELMYPGGTRDFSLKEVLGSVPDDVDLLIFPNYESLPERPDVEDPFTEVSLFKRNYAHVVSEVYYKSYSKVSKGNPNYFITYGNGKSAARIIPGLRSNGAHRWHNYFKDPKEWSSDQAAVLHYTYNKFSDLISRRDRCDCQPTKEDAERCFILPFDRVAFLEASLKNDEQLMQFFKKRLVWEDSRVVLKLLANGLFVRLYEPQLLVRGLREAMKNFDDASRSSNSNNSSSNNSSSSSNDNNNGRDSGIITMNDGDDSEKKKKNSMGSNPVVEDSQESLPLPGKKNENNNNNNNNVMASGNSAPSAPNSNDDEVFEHQLPPIKKVVVQQDGTGNVNDVVATTLNAL